MCKMATLILGLFALGLLGCASEGGGGSAANSNPPISRKLLAAVDVSPQEAAANAEIAARLNAKHVTITHTPTNVVATESLPRCVITPDDQFLFTMTGHQIKKWSLADGKLAGKFDLEPNARPWAGKFPNGFRSGVSAYAMSSDFALADGFKTVIYRINEGANYRRNLETGEQTYDRLVHVMPKDPLLTTDAFPRVQEIDDQYVSQGQGYTVELINLRTLDKESEANVHPDAEWADWPAELRTVRRATLAGFDAPHNVVYLLRVNSKSQWVIDAINMKTPGSMYPHSKARSTLAELGKFAWTASSADGQYNNCVATVSADFRYAAFVRTPAYYAAKQDCVVVDLTTGQTLGTVGPAGMTDMAVSSFAHGLLTLQGDIGHSSRVVTYRVPDLTPMESLQIDSGGESEGVHTTISNVSAGHRFIVVKSTMIGGAVSLTVYDLQSNAVHVLDDDTNTREMIAKVSTNLSDAYAALPARLAEEVERERVSDEKRAQIMREFTAMIRPPTPPAPPPRLYLPKQTFNNNTSVTCSECNGDGVVLTHSYIGGFEREEKTDHGYKTVRYYDESKWGTTTCPHCGGSGRVN